jgi:chromosome segregation ATPase
LGIVAAVGALALAVKAGSEEYNKYNLALEEANKAAEHQKQVYEDVKKAYDDLKKSIENYKSTQDAIDKMTEGTEEWKDAIVEANKEITALIQKYPQLAKYVEQSGNGRLTLNEEGLVIAENSAKNAMNLAYAQSLAATAN